MPSGERHELAGASCGAERDYTGALHGVSIQGADLYCTHYPCSLCAKMLVNAGVRRIVLKEIYPDELARQLLEEAGIKVEIYHEVKGDS